MSSKYSSLLEDQDVRRWIDNLGANSTITAEVYLRTMGLYCDLLRTTPKKILEEARSKQFRDEFTDFVRKMEREGKAGSYIERFKKVILSWLSYNNLDVKLKVNIRGCLVALFNFLLLCPVLFTPQTRWVSFIG